MGDSMRRKIIATIAATVAMTGGSTAAYAAHAAAQHTGECSAVKVANSANFTHVNETLKVWVQARGRYSQTDPRVAAAALTKDQAESAEMRYVVSHGSCFPTADVHNAQKWAALDAAAAARDGRSSAK